MLLHIPGVLTAEQAVQCVHILDGAKWADGRFSSGYLAAQTKQNKQVPEGDPAARQAADLIIAALERNPLFITGALPLKVAPPVFNRYEVGHVFGNHVDNAIRGIGGTPNRLRTDLSVTLFLNAPGDYEGGELVIEDTYGMHSVKLPAGDMIIYPSSSLHHVQPVTRGIRHASIFWVQSMVRDDGQRGLLFNLDMAIQQLRLAVPEHVAILQLTNIYHNLVRRWADV